MRIYEKITDLTGHTPLLKLTNFAKENAIEATILAKLEYFNPARSVKDRICRKRRRYKARRDNNRTDKRKYGNRTGIRRSFKGLPHYPDNAGNNECRTAKPA